MIGRHYLARLYGVDSSYSSEIVGLESATNEANLNVLLVYSCVQWIFENRAAELNFHRQYIHRRLCCMIECSYCSGVGAFDTHRTTAVIMDVRGVLKLFRFGPSLAHQIFNRIKP